MMARRGRARVWLLAAFASAVVVAVLVFSPLGIGGERSPAADPGGGFGDVPMPTSPDTGDPDPLPPLASPLDIDDLATGPLADEAHELERVTQVVETVVDVTAQIAQRGDGKIEGLDEIATGFVLGHMQAMSVEREHLGLTQMGAAEVLSVDPVSSDLGSEPATMLVSVCVDVSGIEVVDAAGNSQSDLLYDPGHPVQYLYGAEFVDEAWKLSTHEIPDHNNCADSTRD